MKKEKPMSTPVTCAYCIVFMLLGATLFYIGTAELFKAVEKFQATPSERLNFWDCTLSFAYLSGLVLTGGGIFLLIFLISLAMCINKFTLLPPPPFIFFYLSVIMTALGIILLLAGYLPLFIMQEFF